MDAESLLEYIKPLVPNHKIPEKLIVMDEFPMTASGKIRRMFLQNQVRESLATEFGF